MSSASAHSSYHLVGPSGEYEEPIPLSTLLILRCAEKHHIRWEAIPGTRLFRLHKGREVKYFYDQLPPTTSYVGYYACADKEETKQLLSAAGIRVPTGYKLPGDASPSLLRQTYTSLRRPLVVKPSHGAQGVAVTTSIKNFKDFQRAFLLAKKASLEERAGVMVEEQFEGTEYRILATRTKVLGVIHRLPANVTGDGTSSIQELIEQKNAEPNRGDIHHLPFGHIFIDRPLLLFLKSQKLRLSDVPRKGKRVFLRGVSNISQGGDGIDMTDEIHPSVKELALKTMQAIPELGFAGIDLMTTNVRARQSKSSYVIIEVNASPGISPHEHPYQGKARHTDLAFLQLLFPELKLSRAR